MRILKIALMQIAPCGSLDGNLKKGLEYCEKAAALGADRPCGHAAQDPEPARVPEPRRACAGAGGGEGRANSRVRSMRCRDAQAMRGSLSARLGQCGRVDSGAGVPHGARTWRAAMGHVARRGGALRAAGC